MPAIHKLKDTFVRSPKLKPRRYSDGGNLYLQVTKTGTKSWAFQYWNREKRKEHQLGFGPYPAVSLAEARDLAAAARKQIEKGIDPYEAKIAARQAETAQQSEADKKQPPTFEDFAATYITANSPGWRNAKHAEQWTSSLRAYALPTIGKLRVDQIETADILKVLQPIWSTKSETAGRVRGRIKAILDAAKAMEHRTGDNPAAWEGHLKTILPKLSAVRTIRPMPAMPYKALPAFMLELQKRQGISARAMEVLILTASRTGSLIGMRDEEINVEEKIWTTPASRMKGGEDFVAPLSDRTLAILQALPREKNNPHLFAGLRAGSHISNMSMLALLKSMAPDCVPHGFRSSFSDWSADESDAPDHVIEMSLAHTIEDETKKAYRRGDMLNKRRKLMTDWARYLYSEEKP